jgi:hypothetical protein
MWPRAQVIYAFVRLAHMTLRPRHNVFESASPSVGRAVNELLLL